MTEPMDQQSPKRASLSEEEIEKAVEKTVLEGAEPEEIHPDDAEPLLKITDLEVKFLSLIHI